LFFGLATTAREEQRELLAAISGLRPEDRLVIAYRYWFDLSEAEMAEALGCPRGTVKSRLSRALKRLRGRVGSSLTPATERAPIPDGGRRDG
jgi:RNA polymerase sigma-70 factor, ECF subfamily